ncbi:pleckstrin homology domain-containing family S member 1-like isoform X1 [Scyliorhinus torazame]|uniref:pleckstrin homology domain-containing family S member 1-like isoform X1 n=1 Tax=Scyliorhinus torazame TaxID=75743 RepID=UPI003B593AC6
MKMTNKGTRLSTVFYVEAECNQDHISESEICFEGYLIKSPPNNKMRLQTSWKKRYFVLTEKEGEHILNYFKYQEDSRKSPPLGKIHLKNVTEICRGPDNHQKWNLIQKMFKCTPECVIFLRTDEREFFFIGEMESVQFWHGSIENVLCVRTMPQSEEQTQDSSGKPEETSTADKSASLYASIPEVTESHNRKSEWMKPKPHVEPSSLKEAMVIYDRPRSIQNRLSQPNQRPVNMEKLRSHSLPPEFEQSSIYDTPRNILAAQWRKERTASNDSGIYMSMASIRDSISTISSQIEEEEEHLMKETNNCTEERKLRRFDVTIGQDIIKNLQFEQIDEKVCVMSSNKECPFNFGDQFLAINKLQISNVKEVSIFINKSMEQEVTVTILRLSETPTCGKEGN